MPMYKKQLSEEHSNKLCGLFESIQLKAEQDNGNLSDFTALTGCFAVDVKMSDEDKQAMAEEWANVEENPLVIDATVDEELEMLESEEIIDKRNDEEDNESTCTVSNDKQEMESDTDGDVVMVSAPKKQQKPKLSLKDAEDRINDLREYAKASDAPSVNMDLLSQLERNFRINNASKSRKQTSMTSFFNKNNEM